MAPVRTTAPPEVMTDYPSRKHKPDGPQLANPTDRIGEMAQQIYGERTYRQYMSLGYGLTIPATGLRTTIHIVA